MGVVVSKHDNLLLTAVISVMSVLPMTSVICDLYLLCSNIWEIFKTRVKGQFASQNLVDADNLLRHQRDASVNSPRCARASQEELTTFDHNQDLCDQSVLEERNENRILDIFQI